MPQPWPRIIFVWSIGLLAAAQLGKFTALMPLMREELSLSLAASGWLISLIEIGGATLGLVAGIAIGRLGARMAIRIGLVLLIIAGIGQGVSPSVPVLFLARIVEGLGYLCITVGAPSLITALAGVQHRAVALTLWSTFVPVGLFIGTALSAGAGTLVSWHFVCFGWAFIALCLLAPILRMPSQHTKRENHLAGIPLANVLLAFGFGCYTLVQLAFLALYPAYLTEQWGMSAADAGTVTGLASLSTIAGSVAASLVLRRVTARPARRHLWLLGLGILPPALLFFFAYPGEALAGVLGPVSVSAIAILLNAITGLISAAAFARMPELLHSKGESGHEIATANGLFAQFGAGGSLIGPPILATFVGQWGWTIAPWPLLGFSLLSFALFILSERLVALRR